MSDTPTPPPTGGVSPEDAALIASETAKKAADVNPGITVVPGTVVSIDDTDISQYIIAFVHVDGDDNANITQAVSLIGSVSIDARVMVMFVPPHGVYLIGSFMGNSICTCCDEGCPTLEQSDIVLFGGEGGDGYAAGVDTSLLPSDENVLVTITALDFAGVGAGEAEIYVRVQSNPVDPPTSLLIWTGSVTSPETVIPPAEASLVVPWGSIDLQFVSPNGGQFSGVKVTYTATCTTEAVPE